MLLPGELLPLHIFEERYKRMIGHCVTDSEPFGIVFRDDEGGARRIGCEARVTEVHRALRRRPPQHHRHRRAAVLASSTATRGPSYPAGEVEPVDRRAGPPTRTPRSGRARATRSPSSSRRVGADAPERDELDALDAYGLAARVELPAETKQRLLELRSEPERMRVLATALGTLVDTVARSREIAERARMNGKLIVGDAYPAECHLAVPMGGSMTLGVRELRHRHGAAAPRVSPAPELARGRVPRDGVDAAEEDVAVRPANDLVAAALEPASAPPRRRRARPARRRPRSGPAGAITASATSRPSVSRRIVCSIAERIRFEPPLPSPASSSPSRRTTVGDIIDGRRRPGVVAVKAERVEVLLAEHVVDVDAGPGDDQPGPGPVRAGDARAHPVAVDRRDVGRRAEPVARRGSAPAKPSS